MGFFFQAEDGIRDVAVTGVQTCALPISKTRIENLSIEQVEAEMARGDVQVVDIRDVRERRKLGFVPGSTRSEERRVGKEWRCGGAPEHGKYKPALGDEHGRQREGEAVGT